MTYAPRFQYTATMLAAMADIGAFQAIAAVLAQHRRETPRA